MELWGIREIAEAYGVHRNSAWRWTRREDFPDRIGEVSGVPVWERASIERWAAENLPLKPTGRPPKRDEP